MWIGWFTARAAQRSPRRADESWKQIWIGTFIDPSKTSVPSSNWFCIHSENAGFTDCIDCIIVLHMWNDMLQSNGTSRKVGKVAPQPVEAAEAAKDQFEAHLGRQSIGCVMGPIRIGMHT